MGLFDPQNIVDAFKDHLDREKAMILKGDLDGVDRLSREKVRLLTRVGRAQVDHVTLENLRGRAERNNRLLAASARGFRTVQEHLKQLADMPATLQTYDRDGQRATLGQSRTDFNKRA